MTDLRHYLNACVRLRREYTHAPIGKRFLCAEDLILQHGREYQYREKPYHPYPRACFDRAYHHATRRRSPWVYVEGFAVNPRCSLPVHHAWVTRADDPGGAFELAWDDAPEAVYIGIPIRADYVRKVYVAGGRQHYSVFDAWWLGHPLLTGQTRLEDVIWKPSTGNRPLRGRHLNQ